MEHLGSNNNYTHVNKKKDHMRYHGMMFVLQHIRNNDIINKNNHNIRCFYILLIGTTQ